ncbi:MAG: RcnB family protein [Betaproteobacteria bacterium]|nr:RcnB family protein [Betaproteobacteria bacterium]
MKYRIGSLATLLVIGLLSSASALAAPAQKGNSYRSPPPRSAPPARQVQRAPAPRKVQRAPAPRQVHRAPPPVYATTAHRPGRSWQVGRQLPRTVVYQEVSAPHYSQYRLAPPPHNHRYVRVGDDILMIAIGTGLIASAIYNISH